MNNYLSIIQAFTHSLTGNKTEEDVCWEITKKVIAFLELEDCVVYLFDVNEKLLIQKAAHGPKNPVALDIYHPITILPGQGIVGSVFLSGQPEKIADTRADNRYIIDDQARLSELAVPIMHEGKAIGVIDSEHSSLNYFTEEHVQIFITLAAIASNKIIQIRSFKQLQEINLTLEKKNLNEIQINEELRKMKSQLEGVIHQMSDDLRDPLIITIGQLDFLEHEPSKINAILPVLRTSHERMYKTLTDLYWYSIDMKKGVTMQDFHLEEVVNPAFESIVHSKKNRVALNINVTGNTLLKSDKEKIKSMVLLMLLQIVDNFPDHDDIYVVNVQVSGHPDKYAISIISPDSTFKKTGSKDKKTEEGLTFFILRQMASKIGAQVSSEWHNDTSWCYRIEL